MLVRSLLTLSLLAACLGCKNQEQNQPAQGPQDVQGTPPTDLSQPASGQQTTGQQQGTAGQSATAAQPTPAAQAPAPQQTAEPSLIAVRLAEIDCTTGKGARHKSWSTSAPEGAKCEETGGALLISAGDNFQLLIREAPADMAGRKRAIEADQNNRFKRYISDQADALVYETDSGKGKPEYYFYATKRVDGTTVVCEAKKGTIYTQPQVEAMVKACQALIKK